MISEDNIKFIKSIKKFNKYNDDDIKRLNLDNIQLIDIKKSNRKNKRYVATFKIGDYYELNIHFGLKNYKRGTYIDHGNNKLRYNYIARHLTLEGERVFNPLTPASLSMFILWGPYNNINDNIELFKDAFNLY